MELIDFSHYTIDMLADYQGSDAKRGIIYNGSRYMLKVSSRIMASNNSGAAGQFSNSSFSEYKSRAVPFSRAHRQKRQKNFLF